MKRIAALFPWLTSLAGIGVTLWLFYPGYMSWDSAYQWWQARHASYDSVHPPLIPMIWRVCEQVWQGPGGMFALQIGLLWASLAAVASSLQRPVWQQCLLVLLLGFWPPLFGLSLHIWKDVWTMLAFAWAVAFLLKDLRQPSRTLRGLALLALVAACAFRHNAITGALPFLFWIAHRENIGRTMSHPLVQKSVLTLLLGVSVLGLAKLPNLDPRVKPSDDILSAVILWDASAVSLAENKLIIPPVLTRRNLTLDDLKTHFSDYSAATVYESGKLLNSLEFPYSQAQSQALAELTWSLPRDHAQAYFQHRLRLTELLLGLDQKALPDGQVLMPVRVPFGDNPPVTAAPSEHRVLVLNTLESWIDTPWFAGWIYLSLALLTSLAMFIKRMPAGVDLSIVVAVSSLAYALPLTLVSGSAEFRYLAWPVLASLISLAILFSSWRAEKPR